MRYKWYYETPNGFDNIVLRSDGEYLIGLTFTQSKDAFMKLTGYCEKNLPIFCETSKWLDVYFSGKTPDFTPKYIIEGITPFRSEVYEAISNTYFGMTITYSDVSKIIAKKRGIKRMSSQAVGGALGYNPICLIIPCHRVIGSNGNLIGYGGGLHNKQALLDFERNK